MSETLKGVCANLEFLQFQELLGILDPVQLTCVATNPYLLKFGIWTNGVETMHSVVLFPDGTWRANTWVEA